jgi:hypothetical protein
MCRFRAWKCACGELLTERIEYSCDKEGYKDSQWGPCDSDEGTLGFVTGEKKCDDCFMDEYIDWTGGEKS